MPTTTASAYPARNSPPLTRMSLPRLPSCSICTNVEATRLGELVNSGLTSPNRTTPSQAVRDRTTETVPMIRARTAGELLRVPGRRGMGGASPRSRPSAFSSNMRHAPVGQARFLLDQRPDPVLALQKRHGPLHAEISRAGERDGEDALHPSGAGREHDHPIGQVDRLVDLMCDEHRGAAGFLPD